MALSLKCLALGAAVVGAGLAVSVSQAAPASAAGLAPIKDCVATQARKLDFSGIVSVVRRGESATYAHGLTAGPGSPPITSATSFNLGSAGKMFTAVAVAQMIDGGKIKLDDPIGGFVRGLTAEASRVTVRQLLDHSSGLGNYFAPENLPALIKARTLRDLLPLVAADKPEFPPGERFAYSDTGFLLLGLLIEQVSGESYGDYVRGHIFAPAGMAATGLDPAPERAIGMTAMPDPMQGVGAAGGQRLLMQPGGPLRPAAEAALYGGAAGGSFSTEADMRKFFAALLSDKLTSAKSLAMLVSPQMVAAKAEGGQPERDYGFGFGVGRFDGHRWFGHNGGAPGVNAEAIEFPDDQVTVVVLANRDPPSATILFRLLRAALFEPAAGQACSRD